MRLTKEEIDIVRETILSHIEDAKIVLFGSRVYDDKKGGDIDLYIETDENLSVRKKIKILAELELKGIARKVDLVINAKNIKDRTIFETIEKEGVVL